MIILSNLLLNAGLADLFNYTLVTTTTYMSTYATETLRFRVSLNLVQMASVARQCCQSAALSQKLTNQSPVVEPVVAWVSCSKVESVSCKGLEVTVKRVRAAVRGRR